MCEDRRERCEFNIAYLGARRRLILRYSVSYLGERTGRFWCGIRLQESVCILSAILRIA
jgi:hypothetical protein